MLQKIAFMVVGTPEGAHDVEGPPNNLRLKPRAPIMSPYLGDPHVPTSYLICSVKGT